MKKELERRNFTFDKLKVEKRQDEKPKITGHAAVFDTLSEDMFGFREKIAKGAFRNTISKDDIRALFNHNPDFILGRNRSGTLKLSEDDEGLRFELDPPDTQAGRDLVVSIERGDVSQASFGFRTLKQEFDESGDTVIRTLQEVQLFDVSPVVFPAYPETDVAVREFRKWKESKVPWRLNLAKLRMKEFDALEQ